MMVKLLRLWLRLLSLTVTGFSGGKSGPIGSRRRRRIEARQPEPVDQEEAAEPHAFTIGFADFRPTTSNANGGL